VATGTEVTEGLVDDGDELEVISEMNEGGVLFGDGIEEDRIDFAWGMRAAVRVAEERLRLVR
jgi:hypothetical protein